MRTRQSRPRRPVRRKGDTPTRYHHGALREALIESAAQLAWDKGVANIALREVGRRAGVSHAAPYHHFPDRAALVAAVAEEGFRRFDVAQARAAAAEHATPRACLEALGIAYVTFAVENPHYFRIMFRRECTAAGGPALAEMAAGAYGRLVEAVRACLGSRGSDEATVQTWALFAWSSVHGLACLWLDGPLLSDEGTALDIKVVAEAVARIVANVISAPRQPSGHAQRPPAS
jgi:AcrR family transcriptional regulator